MCNGVLFFCHEDMMVSYNKDGSTLHRIEFNEREKSFGECLELVKDYPCLHDLLPGWMRRRKKMRSVKLINNLSDNDTV
jgi:hypothetical protein